LVAEVLGTEIHAADPEEMKYVILSRLLEPCAAESSIEVSQADIDACINAMQSVAEQDRQRRAQQRDELVRQLASADPDGAEHAALSAELETLDQFAEFAVSLPTSDSREGREAREQVASAFIRQWKINRALYRQCGGRIIFQQSGPEPLDACRTFLEEQQDKGASRIEDNSLETEFWKYYRTDSIHSFYPAGSREVVQAFESPWWLHESPPQAR
jgi:hypothetical protein